MRFENDGGAVGSLKDHPMTQKTQTCGHGTSQQLFSVILEQIGVLSWKAMGALIVWVKRDMRQALCRTQLVMVLEHGPDSFEIPFRFRPDHVIGRLISSLWDQSD